MKSVLRLYVLAVLVALVTLMPGTGLASGANLGKAGGAASSAVTGDGSRFLAFEEPTTTVPAQGLQAAMAVIRERLRGLGVANATVYEHGSYVVVDLPGAEYKPQVVQLAAETGRFLFRPVDCIISSYLGRTATSGNEAHPPGATAAVASACHLSPRGQQTYFPPHGNSHGVTPAGWDLASAAVVLPYYAGYQYGRYVLGPAEMSGSVIARASAVVNSQTGEWEVALTFTSQGSSEFNRYAAAHYACYERDPSNPPDCARQAVEVDGAVQSAPAIEAKTFPGGAVISGGLPVPFTKQQASDVALVLNYGPLAVSLVTKGTETITPASTTPR